MNHESSCLSHFAINNLYASLSWCIKFWFYRHWTGYCEYFKLYIIFLIVNIHFLFQYKYLNKYNYTLEEHTVTTEDGYILKLHRITTGRNGIYATEGKPPVLLVHGLGSSSMDYVNYGPGRSIGLMLADGGYDVWLANCRGNTWSRNHKNLDPTTREFYQFR